MWLRGIKRLLTPAVLLPLVLVSISAGGSSLFRCQLTGVVSAGPCCPDEGDGAAPPAQAELAPADCCTRETIAFARPLAEAPAARGEAVAIVVVAIAGDAPLISLPPPLASAPLATPDPGAIPRPPILLAKRSLLI